MRTMIWVVAILAGCSGGETTGTHGGPTDTSTGSPTSEAGPAPDSWLGLVRGTLLEADPADAQAYHDGVASYGQAAAQALGDVGHEPFLGTAMLGGSTGAFAGVDRWTDPDGMATLYADPSFAGALGGLFSAPPTVEQFGHEPGWHQWGSLDAADGDGQHFFVVVRGVLAGESYADAQATHDAVAAAGEAGATGLGDVGHQVFLGVDDFHEFLAIDVWADPTNLEALYTDPDFQAAFTTVFAAPPTLAVYGSTDWYQW